MHQDPISNGIDISRLLGRVLKIIHFYYFTHIFFPTYLKFMKSVLLKTRLNTLSMKKRITQNGGRSECYGQNNLQPSTRKP